MGTPMFFECYCDKLDEQDLMGPCEVCEERQDAEADKQMREGLERWEWNQDNPLD